MTPPPTTGSPVDPEALLVEVAQRLEVEDPCTVAVAEDPADAVLAVASGLAGALVDVEAGRSSDARARASRAVGRARRSNVPALWLGRAVAASAWALGATDHRSAGALARRAAAESDDPWTVTLGAIVQARGALALGDAAGALRLLERATPLPRLHATTRALEVRALLASNQPLAARHALVDALDVAATRGPWAVAELLAASAGVRLATEEADLGHAAVNASIVELGASRAPAVAFLHHARGDFERWAGRLDTAAASYEEARARLEACRHPHALALRGQLCLVHLLAGRLDAARDDLAAFERSAPPGVAAVLGAAIAAAAGDREGWARHHEHARAWLVPTGTADHALCFRLAREAWSAALDRDDRSRAFRAGAAALAEWGDLGRARERRDELRKLRALASLGVPVPAGPFDLLEELGAGGAGVVFRGRHHVHGIEVAVKVLRRTVTGDDSVRAAFSTEIRVVAGLEHPGIVRILGHGELDETAAMAGELPHGAPWYAMQLVAGGTAQEVVGRLKWSACRGILVGVLDALAHAHARSVLHLDIKPANVLLEAIADQPGSFRPRITDFGLSGLAEGGAATGTPQYMAPEQFRARDLGPWTDLYAVGCLATALVTGFPPFRRKDVDALRQAHLGAEPPELAPVVQVPVGFEEWILKLLEKIPTDRFETAADAAWALHRLVDPPTDEPPRNASAVHQNTAPISFSLGTWEDGDDGDDDDGDRPRSAGELPPMPVSWRPPKVEPLPGLQALELFGLKRPPVVGRQRERDLLWATLASVHRERRPRLVALEGRGGSGRTQLAAWLAETASERGVAAVGWLVARGSRLETGAFARALGAQRDLRGALETWAVADRARFEEWRRRPVEVEDTDPDGGEERERGRRAAVAEDTVRVVVAAATAAAARRPVVIVLDGAPATNVDAVEVARRLLVGDAAALVVMVASPGQDVSADRRYEELLDLPPTMAITLDPLRPGEVRELLRTLLPVEPALAERVVDRSAADVDLATAHLRDLVRRDALREDRGVLVLRDGQDLAVGGALLRTWVDRLEVVLELGPRALRDALGTLALAHRDFTPDEWKAVADAHEVTAPSRWLRALRTRRVVVPSGERGLAFAHPSVPDHLLEEAEADGRLGGLARVALEQLTFDHPAWLGLALLDAAEPAAALEPLSQGGALARDRGDTELARRIAGAHEAALQMVGAPETDSRWLPVLLARAHVAARDGDRGRALAQAESALQLATQNRRGAEEYEAALLTSSLELDGGDAARADEHLKRALAVARRLEDPRRVARVRSRVAAAAFGRGDLDGAARQYQRGLDDLTGLPWDEGRAELSLGLGRVQAARGQMDLAEASFTAALGSLTERGDASRAAQAMASLGRLALLRGHPRDAARWFAAALDRLPDSDRRGRADLLLDECTIMLAEERWDALRANVERVLSDHPSLPTDSRAWALGLHLAALAPEPGAGFDRTHDTLQALLRSVVVASVELARVLERAAGRASAGGRRRQCWTLAEAQWRTLGEREAARRAREQARRATDG